MKLDLITNKNDEFYTPRYAIEPLLKYVPDTTRVWCPFDTEQSLIVKSFVERGNDVVYSHIASGEDFFSTYKDCDVIVSNPPYSIKGEVFQRLFDIGKPFAMLVGVVGLFESEKRFSMFLENDFEIMYLNRRVAYFKDYSDEKPSLNPPFSSVWLCSNLLPKQVIFERVKKS